MIKAIRLLGLLTALTAFTGCRAWFPSDGARFETVGVQVGETLPPHTVHDLDGTPRPWSEAWAPPSGQAARPAVLIGVSRSCPVARYRMMDVRSLRKAWGDQIDIVLLYTLEAHPTRDPSPYHPEGKPWLTGFNRVENVRLRQATDHAGRRALAQAFAERHAPDSTVWVDTLDNAGWDALGRGPNTAVLIDADGVVRAKHGWFDGPTMETAVAVLFETPSCCTHDTAAQ